MPQDSNAPDPPASSKDREALAAIARQIAIGGRTAWPAPTERANGSDGVSRDADPPQERVCDRAAALGPEAIAGLLQVLPGGIGICIGDTLVHANDAFALAFGYRSTDALIAAGGVEAVLPGLRDHLNAIGDGMRSRSAPQLVTVRARSRSGRRFELPVSVRRAGADDGDPSVLVLHPIADARPEPPVDEPAEALTPELLHDLADGISDGLVRVDANGMITALSPRAALVLGIEHPTTFARAFRSVVGQADGQTVTETLARLFAAPKATAGERLDVRLAGDDGPPRLSLSLARSRDRTGCAWIMLHALPPVPEPKVRETEARREEAAEPTAQDPEPADTRQPDQPERRAPPEPAGMDFLAKVSHEVRTPLNSIIGFAELMREQRFGRIGNSRYRGYVDDIYESGVYALGLINDLLDISKLEAGRFELNFTAVDANEVIAETVRNMQPRARHGRVMLRMSLAESVPRVLADRRSLKQILLNLVSNAIKFTHAGGQVVVSSRRGIEGAVHLGVRDNGIGMSEAEIAQALKPFEQLDVAPRKQGGTGLGLPLTKALVQANHARFELESGPGLGTRADVVLPADRLAEG